MLKFAIIQITWGSYKIDADRAIGAETNSIGCLSLATYLHNKLPTEIETTVIDDLDSFDPCDYDIIGLSVTSPHYMDAIELAKNFKQITNTPIIIGGIHISVRPEDFHEAFDVGVVGEGELTLTELVELLITRGNFTHEHMKAVKGIVYMGPHGPITTPERPLIDDLNDIPIPDYRLPNIPNSFQPRIFSSRGCLFNCHICTQKKLWRGSFRSYSIENTLNQIRNILERHPDQTHIGIDDDLFFYSKKRTREFLGALKKEPFYKKIRFTAWIRADMIDEDMCQLLTELNISQISFGFENASDRLLKKMNKKTRLKDNLKAIDLLSKQQIPLTVTSIIGFPTETEQEIRYTFKVLEEAILSGNCQFARINILSPYPDTYYWKEFIKNNEVTFPFNCDRFKYQSYLDCIEEGTNTNYIEEWIRIREQTDCVYVGGVPKNRFYEILRELLPPFHNLFLNRSNFIKKTFNALNLINNNRQISEQTRYAIYGTGVLTHKILPDLNLSKGHFLGFYDSDTQKQESNWMRHRIRNPKNIPNDNPDIIFVSAMSSVSTQAIGDTIRDTGYTGHIISLVTNVSAPAL